MKYVMTYDMTCACNGRGYRNYTNFKYKNN